MFDYIEGMISRAPRVAPGGIIRHFEAADAGAVTTLIGNTLLVSNSGHYTVEEISRLAAGYSAQSVGALSEHSEVWVYEEEGLIQGVVSVDRTTIQALFVAPDRQGKGIGRVLLGVAEAAARRRGVTELQVPASLTALGFYERMGFRSLGPGRSAGGVAIERMAKEL
jgi:GNAT superfamily N-acetyltransferase